MLFSKSSRPVVALSLAGLVTIAAAAPVSTVPKLADTHLYTATASDCHQVDLSTWKHPTLDLLRKSPVIESVKWVQLCNGKAFPIFGVDARLDRNSTHTDADFLSLYVALSKANGSWPSLCENPGPQMSPTP